MSIRITGMFSGLDTESIISELVSAQSVKKNSLVKAQTKLSWKQDAWKALNTKIFDFYTNTLSDMRYQGSYMKKTTKVSNTNAINVITSSDAVDGVRSVMVKQLAKGSRLTSGALNSKSGVYFGGTASLALLRKHRGEDVFGKDDSGNEPKDVTGSFRVIGAQGQYVDFNVNENTTIDDVVNMIKTTGLNANYDQESQRIFISSKNTGEANNFNLVANDEGGMNALALLGLLSEKDLDSADNRKWAAYGEKNADGSYSYTDDFYNALSDEITKRQEALQASNEALEKQNTELNDKNGKLATENTNLLSSLTNDDLDALSSWRKFDEDDEDRTVSKALDDLYKDNGLYDKMVDTKATYTKAQTTLTDKQNALQKAQEDFDAVKDSGDADAIKTAQDALTTAQKEYDDAEGESKKAGAAYDKAQGAYNDAYDEIANYVNDVVYGPLVNKEVQGLENSEYSGTYYQLQDENGKALDVYEKLNDNSTNDVEYYASDGTLLYKKKPDGSYVDKDDAPLEPGDDGNILDKDGNILAYKDGDGKILSKREYVKERDGRYALKEAYEKAEKDGNVEKKMQDQVAAINKLNNVFLTVGQNKTAITANSDKIASNNAEIASNNAYMSYATSGDDVDNMAVNMSKLAQDVQDEFEKKVDAATKSLEMAEAAKNPESDEYKKIAGMFAGTKIDAQDAKIEIDGAEFTSMTNTFSVNGLTLTAQEVTDKEVTLTTSTDADGVYDMIKNFFSEYNKLINEMDSLYNAESSKGYEPLLSEEKEALSDNEVEEWEKKIKDSLLRRDSTLSSISFSMASALLQGAEVNGKKMYLSDFGINTLGYFKAAENEKNAYHIDGDQDDASTKANEDILKSMIASDPETVMNFFTKLSTNLYDELTKKMAGTTLSSAMTVYNDKQMKSDYASYTDKIKKQEDKLNSMMDKWYKKFSAMEVAMSKLESRSSSLSSILGG